MLVPACRRRVVEAPRCAGRRGRGGHAPDRCSDPPMPAGPRPRFHLPQAAPCQGWHRPERVARFLSGALRSAPPPPAAGGSATRCMDEARRGAGRALARRKASAAAPTPAPGLSTPQRRPSSPFYDRRADAARRCVTPPAAKLAPMWMLLRTAVLRRTVRTGWADRAARSGFWFHAHSDEPSPAPSAPRKRAVVLGRADFVAARPLDLALAVAVVPWPATRAAFQRHHADQRRRQRP